MICFLLSNKGQHTLITVSNCNEYTFLQWGILFDVCVVVGTEVVVKFEVGRQKPG